MNKKAIMYIVVASFCFGCFPTINKYLLNKGVDPINLVLAVSVFLFPIVVIYTASRYNDIKQISKINWKYIIIIALFATAVGRTLSIFAQKFTLAMNASVLMKLTVIFVPIIAYFAIGERLKVKKYIAMIIAFIGTFLLITGGSLMIPYSGDMVFIILAILLSFTNVLAKKVSKSVDPFILSSLRLTIGSGLIFLLISIAGFEFVPIIIEYPLYLILLAILGIGLAFALYKGIELSTASEATALFLLSAPIGLIFAYVFLRETLSTISLIGASLILGGCYFVAKK